MPDGKRWYPLGSVDWWKEFGKREAKGWADIGRAALDIFDPRTPIFPERYPTERYPTGERVQRFRQAQPSVLLFPSLRERWQPTTVPYTGFGQEFNETRVEEPDKNAVISQILLMGKALGSTPEDLLNTYGGGMYLSWDEVPMDDAMGMPGLISMASRIRDETQGLGKDVYSLEGRQRLAEAVGMGAIPSETFTDWSGRELATSEQAFGKGSEWEKWQHGEAELSDKQRQFSERQNVEKTIQSIQQRGYDSPEEYYTAIMGAYQDAYDTVSSGTYQQELAQRKMTIANQLQEYKLTKAGQAGQAFAADYKPWYEKFLETPEYKALAQETYLTPTETGAVFRNWALAKPEFKADVIKQETQKLQDYPTLHPWYKETRKPDQTFQTWLGETPLAQAYYRERRAELEAPRARSIPKWASTRV